MLAHIDAIQSVVTAYSNDLDDSLNGQVAVVAGCITHIRHHVTAKGKSMAFATLEDLQGTLDLVIFPRTWAEVRDTLEVEQLVFVKGKVDAQQGDGKILVDEIKSQWDTLTPISGAQVTVAPSVPSPKAGEASVQPEATSRPASLQLRETSEIPYVTESSPPPDDLWDTFDLDDNGGNELDAQNDVEANENLENESEDTADTPPANGADDLADMAWQERPSAAPRTNVVPAGEAEVEDSEADSAEADAAQPQAVRNVQAASASVASQVNGRVLGAVRPPLLDANTAEDLQENGPPKRIVLTLRPTNDMFNYKLRVKWAYNVFTGFPGRDRFAIVVYEDDGRCFELNFVNNHTGYCEELISQLASIVKTPEDIDIQPLLL